jgi:hypothetical protein
MKYFLFALVITFSTMLSAKEVRCTLQDSNGEFIYDETQQMEEGGVYNFTLIENEQVSITAFAAIELISIQTWVRNIQNDSFGHLGLGVRVSDNETENSYYALCEIKLDEKK